MNLHAAPVGGGTPAGPLLTVAPEDMDSFTFQDSGAVATVRNAGRMIHGSGNGWMRILIDATITPETVTEFTLTAAAGGELYVSASIMTAPT